MMELQFYGANCVVMGNKQTRIVVDDNLAELGAKSISKEGDIALCTGVPAVTVQHPKLLIDQPGEYEVSGVSIYGIAARSHMDTEGQKTATMYKLMLDDTSILITGHIYPELSDAQLEAIGMVDVMIVPVGGNGFTLDGVGALKLIKKVEPKTIIPTHYDDTALAFSVPQQPLEQALKSLAMEPKEPVSKFKLKGAELSDVAQLVLLEKS
jgi:L-ascorbate metabolism protein UlaG (beta-lactamase superfamily)